MTSEDALIVSESLEEDLYKPPVPQTIEQTGLTSTLIEQLLVKTLYFGGELVGRDLADALGLKFRLFEACMDVQ
jgi:hypothetical protein